MEDKDILNLLAQVSLADERFMDKDLVWNKIAEKAQHRHVTLRRSRVYWRIAAGSVAAAISFVIIGLWSIVDIRPDMGTLSHLFPDGSVVELTENSSVSYNRIGWIFGRHVKLVGDASFDVVKDKGIFKVDTDYGSITVLGTQFQVKQSEDCFHVSCTEGKVEVSTDAGKKILNIGEQVSYSEGQMVVTPIIPAYLEFDNASLSEVVSQVGKIYGLTVTNKEICEGRIFSGWVSTSNVEEALEVIMLSCDVDYHLEGSTLIIDR